MQEQNNFREERKEEVPDSIVIPVVQEQVVVSKEQAETAKIKIQTKVTEVENNINIPLLQENYEVKRIPVNKYVDAHPPVREEGDEIIIPVVREVLVVEKRLELVEEVHVIKSSITIDHKESIKLKKEEVNIERIQTDNPKL